MDSDISTWHFLTVIRTTETFYSLKVSARVSFVVLMSPEYSAIMCFLFLLVAPKYRSQMTDSQPIFIICLQRTRCKNDHLKLSRNLTKVINTNKGSSMRKSETAEIRK